VEYLYFAVNKLLAILQFLHMRVLVYDLKEITIIRPPGKPYINLRNRDHNCRLRSGRSEGITAAIPHIALPGTGKIRQRK
jgi:hypothetical protein